MTRRHRLTPDGITDRALSIADRDGLDRVTLRALAAELDVTPMALYNHFPDKGCLTPRCLGGCSPG